MHPMTADNSICHRNNASRKTQTIEGNLNPMDFSFTTTANANSNSAPHQRRFRLSSFYATDSDVPIKPSVSPFRRRSDTAISEISETMMTTSTTPSIVSCNSSMSAGSDTSASSSTSASTTDALYNRQLETEEAPSVSSSSESSASYYSCRTTATATRTKTTFDSNNGVLLKRDARDENRLATTATAPQFLLDSSSVLHPEIQTMKRHRRDKTAMYGVGGAVVGTILLPVVGTVVGGAITSYAANQCMKCKEKKIRRKWERDQFQRDADASPAATLAVFA